MKRRAILASPVLLITALFGLSVIAQNGPATDKTAGRAPADKGPADAAAAAKKFLATLDDAQRGKVVFDFHDDAQRRRWSNLPPGIVQRAGLRMGDLTPPQRAAAMTVLAAALSKQGYEKVLEIVQGDEMLRTNGGGGGPGSPGGRGGRGGGPGFGRDNYYISFLGQPSETEPWMIQFGGHHLGLNITLVGRRGTLAPSHTGAQPAAYEFEGKTVRPLGREADKARALLDALDEAQRKQAVLGYQVRDLALGPGRDGRTIQPEGVKGSALTEKQREMMLDIAVEWTGIMSDEIAKAKLEEMEKNLAETWFAWSGPTEKGGAAYFRIQGPTVVIEYAPQRGSGGSHLHTIYRDPTNDYGRGLIKK
jgi:hypothetical protein